MDNKIDEFSFNKALINCFLNINCLINYFKLNKIKCLTTFKNDENKKLSREFSYILFDFIDGNNNRQRPYNFDNFKNVFNNKNPNIFINSSENNIKRLFLLQKMHEELNEIDENEIIEEFESDQTVPEIELYKCKTAFESKNKSIISKNFYFSQAKITKCNKCNKLLYDFMIDNILIFNIEKTRIYKERKNEQFINLNIYDCFDFYTTEEKNIGENKKFCGKCNLEYNITNKISSFSLPEIFIIYLERENNKKFECTLQINDKFELFNKYEFKFNNMTEHIIPQYELIGIVVESEEDRGNFLSYSKYNEKWYLDNNSKFEIVAEFKDNIKNIPHLLIYQKTKE